ncbi:MAG: response regulator [Parvularcula sp.]|jgi:two-component system cell cycle response regulator DivK|nr:response regulator [Parvularcula sp.]
MNDRKTILVVEDNELNMKLFHDLLEVQGYDILQTGSGDDAFRMAMEHRPDLILMDIQLPEKSGLDVTREIKAEPAIRDIPVIAVTAFAMKDDEERIRAAGCDDYLAKPISVTAFLEKVKRVLS